ncbi:aldo/keto reductase [Microbacterium sp. EYE_5]|uniref:aldo/keto reductase n=1 Tax=unclassified Microbacterium TaxID=2609290 RepID=UPI00200625C9|nr:MULTISPECIES: aldo/keto reductase [unclassified Microbacterium]MCK6079426.1 aldo/keto reductase [Microbacterium sp. EYE_382]MCK6084696.1 aldo/keto reductase [Microbacterium sp. EYE_384]MCK6123075.1 aldo/keto reductase [Microbacterium sp. EYE_80]MCK6125460.1 aldo/keto reductase [Microbacterium sp. EYE_79]MCK6140380.1 aldo/keto reductase [Microbacterium sp. EYE_39]
MRSLSPTPVILGASRLGEREGGDQLADALLASTIGYVDTSNNYAGGRSEELLGSAIRRAGGLPQDKLVYSKADSEPGTGVFDGDRVKRSLDESLTRLGLESLPLYQLHDPYTISFDEAMGAAGAVPALLDLREQGLIGAVGIASGTLAQVQQYVDTGVFDVVLSHNRYTLVDRSATTLFETARSLGMTVVNAAPFGGGTLANNAASYGYREMPADFAAHLERVRALAQEHGVDLAAAALHFSLRSDLVDATVVGIPSIERLAALPQLIDAEVPDAFFDAVDALGEPPASGND